jgi:uncharacterized protein
MDLLDRVGVIAEIARAKANRSGRLGKTAMMKLLHILEDGYGVPLGYRFSLYNYGPYDSSVMSDIDHSESLGQVKILFDEEAGYQITPTSIGEVPCPSAAKGKLDELLKHFGDMNARELELRSTLLFLSQGESDRGLGDRLREIKPKYSLPEVEAALDELKRLGILSGSSAA